MNVHIAQAPALDAAEAVASPLSAPRPQDWEQLVSPGHVLRERLLAYRMPVFAVGLACGLAALATIVVGPRLVSAAIPDAIYDALLVDPATYVDLGDGVRTSYRLAWLAEIPRQTGLSPDAWKSLVGAVVSDLNNHGLDAASWTATAELPTAPRITRPAKAFAENVDRMATGIVIVPEDIGFQRAVQITAWVDGRLSWVSAIGGDRLTVFGLETPECPAYVGPNNQLVEQIAQYRPASVAAKAGE